MNGLLVGVIEITFAALAGFVMYGIYAGFI